MAQTEIKAVVKPRPVSKDKAGKDIPATKGGEATAAFNMPGNLAEASKAWGEDVVFAAAEGAVTISVQALMRRMIDAGKTPAEISKAVAEYKPNVRTVVRQSAYEKATSAARSMTAEERAKLLKELQGMK